eukprot:8830862-Pyramimonas_sp.AAC.1
MRDHESAVIEERKLYRGGAPWAWPRGDGRGCCTDPNTAPYKRQLTEADNEPRDSKIAKSIQIWDNLTPIHYLKQFNRDWHSGRAGEPADPKSEEEDGQKEADADGDDEMAEEADPADAAPAGHASDDYMSTDPGRVDTERMDLSPERWIAYRAE